MTNQAIPQSQKRNLDSTNALFLQEDQISTQVSWLFIKSSTDVGVERNQGRNGARLAPQSFLSYFKKLNQKVQWKGQTFKEIEVSSESLEREDFSKSQIHEADKIGQALGTFPYPFFCHLGGGHDHVYPLLMNLGKSHQHIIILNIDAHADTRTDESFNSGTPFRQFAKDFTGRFELYQIGLHEFANSTSTLSPLPQGKMTILWKKDFQNKERRESFFQNIRSQIKDETVVFFSLDADALNAAEVPGVSAVNGNGISRNELTELWSHYRSLSFKHKPMLGIYELNPVYDTLSMVSMRTLATWVYEILE